MKTIDAIIEDLEAEYGVSYDQVEPEATPCCEQEDCIDAYKSELTAEFEAYKEKIK